MIYAAIPNYKCINAVGGGRSYYTYTIEVHNGNNQIFTVDRRYSDFLCLHKEIKKLQYDTPFFPPKKVRNATIKVLETRRILLEKYIQAMLNLSPVPREILRFLNISSYNLFHSEDQAIPFAFPFVELQDQTNSSRNILGTESDFLSNPGAGFIEDPYLDSDSSNNLSDTILSGVLSTILKLPLRRKLKMPTLLQKNQIIVFCTTWLSYAILYFLRKPLGVIKPSLETEFKISKTQLGWLDVSLLLPYSIVQLSSSRIGDKFGPRLIISICLTIAGSSMFTFGFWSSYNMLLVIMFINGAMQGPCWPACCKAVCAWYPDAKLNSIVGFMSTAVFIGGAAGTALAVHLQSQYGWRMVHVPSSVVSVMLGLLVFFVLRSPEEKHITIPGKDFKVGEDSGPPKKTFWQLWKIPAVFEISITVLCLKVVRYCMFMWLPMYMVHSLHYSVAQAGMFSTIFDIGGAAGSPIIGVILDRKFKKNTLLGMWIFVSISSLSMALFTWTSSWGFLHNAIFMFLAGATNGGTDSLLAGSVSMKMGEANGMKMGAAVTGLINGFGTTGAILEGPLIGWISDKYGWDTMFTLTVILSAIASLMIARAMVVQRRADKLLGEDKEPLIS